MHSVPWNYSANISDPADNPHWVRDVYLPVTRCNTSSMIRVLLIRALCSLAVLAMLLHGVAVMACDSVAQDQNAGVGMADEAIAACPACAEPDSPSAGADSCGVACSSVTGCIHTSAGDKDGERSYAVADLLVETERPLTVEPPPPRSMLLV